LVDKKIEDDYFTTNEFEEEEMTIFKATTKKALIIEFLGSIFDCDDCSEFIPSTGCKEIRYCSTKVQLWVNLI
jgi:hypothetical protein